MADDGRADAVAGTTFFRRLVDEVADDRNRDTSFIILVDQSGHLQQWPRYALGQHQEAKQGSYVNRIVGRQRKVNANGEGAVDSKTLERSHTRLYHVACDALSKPQFSYASSQHIPKVALT